MLIIYCGFIEEKTESNCGRAESPARHIIEILENPYRLAGIGKYKSKGRIHLENYSPLLEQLCKLSFSSDPADVGISTYTADDR